MLLYARKPGRSRQRSRAGMLCPSGQEEWQLELHRPQPLHDT